MHRTRIGGVQGEGRSFACTRREKKMGTWRRGSAVSPSTYCHAPRSRSWSNGRRPASCGPLLLLLCLASRALARARRHASPRQKAESGRRPSSLIVPRRASCLAQTSSASGREPRRLGGCGGTGACADATSVGSTRSTGAEADGGGGWRRGLNAGGDRGDRVRRPCGGVRALAGASSSGCTVFIVFDALRWRRRCAVLACLDGINHQRIHVKTGRDGAKQTAFERQSIHDL